MRDALSPLGYGDAKIQEVNDPELGKNVFQIATSHARARARSSKVQDALDSEVRREDVRVLELSSIGPTFGAQIARTAVIAIIASLLLISIYIGLRFESKFAVPVLIALVHDLLITAGVYALTDREVTTSTVAALLTILGYSLYDTIIVFDRIRENVPRMPRATFSQIVNRSMSEVLDPVARHELLDAACRSSRCCSSAARRCRTSRSRCSSASPPAPTRRSSSPRRC